MRLNGWLEGLIGAGAASAVAVGSAVAIRYNVPKSDIISALASLTGIALGVFGAIGTTIYLANRKRTAERASVRYALVGLIACLEGAKGDLPRPNGNWEAKALDAMERGATMLGALFAAATKHASELDFMDRGTISAWPGRCENLTGLIGTYRADLDQFRRGQAYVDACNRLADEIVGEAEEMIAQARVDLSFF